MTESPHTGYRFGDVVLDVSNLRLTVDGEVRQLEPKSFRLLEFLIENRQRVVPKDEVLQVVWEGVAVSDNALTRAVAQIRKALDDDPKQPRYIETVPTVGYRFAAEVNVAVAQPPVIAPVRVPPPSPRKWRPFVWTALALGLIGAGVSGYLLLRRPAEPAAANKPVPLTTYIGREVFPSFSPDGNQVAFTWNGEHEENFDIYVKTIGSEAPLRITTDPAFDLSPEWSPDGRTIAFERVYPGGRVDVMLIPPLGGAERKLIELESHWNQEISGRSAGGTAWSPDGKWLAVTGDIGSQGADSIFLVSVETGEARQITRSPARDLGNYEPVFSPDGSSLLFMRAAPTSSGDLYRVALNNDLSPRGEPQKVPTGNLVVDSPIFASSGKEILFLSNGMPYRMPPAGTDQPSVIDSIGSDVRTWGIQRDGRRLAYSVPTRDTNIWRLDLTTKDAAPERWIASTKRDVAPQYSPDGRRIAYYSNRGGSYQIWVSDADGSKAAVLTSMKFAGTPRWSPDGRTIAFDSNDTGRYQVYTISADGGKIKQLTNGPTEAFGASWSRDGKWIYFASSASGDTQVWKMRASGGMPMQVTQHGGMSGMESEDGKTLYYNKAVGNGSLWKMPVAGGPEQKVVDTIYRFNFAVVNHGVYLTRDGSIDFVDAATGAIRNIVKTPRPDTGLALSPDGRYLLYAKVDTVDSDLMLVENFH